MLSLHTHRCLFICYPQQPWAGFAHPAVEQGQRAHTMPWSISIQLFSAQVLSFGFNSDTYRKVMACVLKSDIFCSFEYKAEGLQLPNSWAKRPVQEQDRNKEHTGAWGLVPHSSTPKEPIAAGTSVERNKNSNKTSNS